MVTLTPIQTDGISATAVTVQLPKTSLVAVSTEKGYIMCGALDVPSLNTRLSERRIIAGRAFGVRTVADLLEAPLVDVTDAARDLGIVPGMKGRDALRLMQ
ncbi:MAG TPA: DUF1805 domain-containing protein [Symbiobacteriaceae bacterium]|nr:DUF1805 domain-containing protein [Symbiobacteriaceae bacterium]